MAVLPIDALLPEIGRSLAESPNLVIEAPPGAGKTTRVPASLLGADFLEGREIWVLEPRRLPARLAARRVATERGEKPGEVVGYQVRYDEVAGPRTRLRFVTEGILTRRLLADPLLNNIGAVVLDEFHERHLQSDMALSLLKRLQSTTRPDLRLVVMSATLEADPVGKFLGNCSMVRSEGRLFPITVEHLPRPEELPLEKQVARAIRGLVEQELDGDVLVFLPGAREIRLCQRECEELASQHDLVVRPLHGDLPADEQDRAVTPGTKRKIILSTNVAESSVTIEGVSVVIDSGLARVAGHSPWTGLPTLEVKRISKSSAMQRAGRAGRTREGRCLRLYTYQDFAARPDHDDAEIKRLDLAQPLLELHGAGIGDATNFDWFETPPSEAIGQAEGLLKQLGALDAQGQLSSIGKVLLRFPVHPRLGRIILEAERRGVASQACTIAAIISERDIRRRRLFTSLENGKFAGSLIDSPSDLIELRELFIKARDSGFRPDLLARLELDPGRVRSVEQARLQLLKQIGANGYSTVSDPDHLEPAEETALLISILAGFPDRVARRRTEARRKAVDRESELLLSNGGTARLAAESVVRKADFMVAVQAEQRSATGRSGAVTGVRTVNLASAIEPEWLIDLFPENVTESAVLEWNPQTQRVESVERMLFDYLVLDEVRKPATTSEEAATILAQAVLNKGTDFLYENETVKDLRGRALFLRTVFPEAGVPMIDDETIKHTVTEICLGFTSMSEVTDALNKGAIVPALQHQLTSEHRAMLSSMAPGHIVLKKGRRVRLNYDEGKPPWVASRLQDFFGMKETPRIAGGRVAVVLHLLAPNQRPVQVTSDLAGFWTRHYPQIKRELGRRYPRHAWPDDPLKVL